MAQFDDLINQLYQEQLGRAPDASGAEFWASQLASGASAADIARAINSSLEGQNFDTQLATSVYRQELGRNPEQAGYQYWQSAAQSNAWNEQQLRNAIASAAATEQAQRGITGGFTNMELADLEADPYGGRYATNSIYDMLPNSVNASLINGIPVQFVAPPTQQMYSTNFGNNGASWEQTVGVDVLNTPAVQAAVQRAINSGSMTPEEYRTMYSQLENAQNMEDVYAAFNAPKAQVVIDAVYGQQTGEANTLAQARAEAAQRQAVLDANNLGYYQANPQLAAQYEAAGLYYPFGADAYSGYDTRVTGENVVTDENFNDQLNNTLRTLYGNFGGSQDMLTPLTGQYYSESGLQPGYTAPSAGQNTFRSGVAGYTPNLPTMFQFGNAPVDASFQQYRPGAFQPSGVVTGGFITGYNANGTPIYSQYNNPNLNVAVPTTGTTPINQNTFDAQAYLAANPDVAADPYYGQNPWAHYVNVGRNEPGRNVTLLSNYNPPSTLNPYVAPTSAPANAFFTAPNGQIFASEAAYNASQPFSGG